MVTALITLVFILILICLVLIYTPNSKTDKFFSKDFTTKIKGICAIFVVLVHVPADFQNAGQNALGSFAFVAVTIFFMVSSYGMHLNAEKKSDYLKHFWRNRLASLLIPCLILNLIIFASKYFMLDIVNIKALISINSYVLILLEYCILFYVVTYLGKLLKIKNKNVIDIIIICGVIISSLYFYFIGNKSVLSPNTAWCFERMGLIWGILLYRFFNPFKTWISKSNIKKTLIFLALGLLAGFCYLKFKTEYFYGEYILKILLGLVLISLLLIVTYNRKFGNSLGIFLGNISFEIYLCHDFIMEMLSHYYPTLRSDIFIISTFVIVFALSIIMNLANKKLVKLVRK